MLWNIIRRAYEEYVVHQMGITVITMAFVFLLINNKYVKVPPMFFFLYAIGGYLIMYEMHNAQLRYDVSTLELIGATISMYLGYLMYARNVK